MLNFEIQDGTLRHSDQEQLITVGNIAIALRGLAVSNRR
jgi:hypothetical protein